MPLELSCGAVVFTRVDGELRYLVIRSPDGLFHSFPKGHMEPGETEQETALREIREETGLSVRLVGDFRTAEEYPLLREGRPDIIKRVVYFLAEYENQHPRAQEGEVSEVLLMPRDEAMQALYSDSVRRILREADAYLAKHSK